ncbi:MULTISPECIES: hypothetical protein [Nostocales]|uniref:Uncharacterized protein n=3 Tax=Nostocales TaxID=1161 RepID=A0A0C1R061_9CYAN|nr:hypothetical protein [Tolypothrix bouteillei]KAF3885050.1 hypothetical protein DA73_0400005935 [Tolypothrix bouteillei VB521301]
MYSDETTPNQAEKTNPQTDESQLSPEMRDRIKHPPKMDDVLLSLSPDELRNNQAVVPEMLDEPTDEMIGFTKE